MPMLQMPKARSPWAELELQPYPLSTVLAVDHMACGHGVAAPAVDAPDAFSSD